MKRLLYSIAVLVGLAGAVAIGQQLVQQALTGNEAVLVQGGGPGGPGAFTNVTALRDAHNYALIGGGTTITQTVSPSIGEVIVTAAITTLNLSLPATPYDGQTVRLSCPGGIVSTIVVSAPFGGTINGLGATITPATSVSGLPFIVCNNTIPDSITAMWTFTTTPAVWFRVQ